MKISKIVITGAPGSGKTEFMARQRSVPEFQDHVFLDELARDLLAENAELRHHPEDLHCEIYRRQVKREDELNGRSFFTDRGTIDGFAFHRGSMDLIGTTIEREYRRYTAVVQLGSSAGLGEKYYHTDEIRQESMERSLAVEKALTELWSKHPGYIYLEAEPEVEKKYDKFVELVRGLAL
jgi:predicted ATPase